MNDTTRRTVQYYEEEHAKIFEKWREAQETAEAQRLKVELANHEIDRLKAELAEERERHVEEAVELVIARIKEAL